MVQTTDPTWRWLSVRAETRCGYLIKKCSRVWYVNTLCLFVVTSPGTETQYMQRNISIIRPLWLLSLNIWIAIVTLQCSTRNCACHIQHWIEINCLPQSCLQPESHRCVRQQLSRLYMNSVLYSPDSLNCVTGNGCERFQSVWTSL